MRIMPILFNTDMVRALLEKRKTVTRRVIKSQPPIDFRYPQADNSDSCWWWTDKDGDDDMMGWWPSYENGLIPPYKPGDILYVRETWGDYATYTNPDGADYFMYRADYPDGATTTTYPDGTVFDLPTWRPSIHMPKEAARIFLRVKAVRAERLKDITEEQARAEVFGSRTEFLKAFLAMYPDCTEESWVWVIEIERVEKPEGWPI